MNAVPTAYPRSSHKAVLAEVLSPERASVRHKNCDGFLAQAVAADPVRRERLPAVEAGLRCRFAADRAIASGFELDQPMRLNLFVQER